VIVLALVLVGLLVVEAKHGTVRKLNRAQQEASFLQKLKNKPLDVQQAVATAISHRAHFAASFCTDSVAFPGNAKVGFTPLTSAPAAVYPTFRDSNVPMVIKSQDHTAIVEAGEKIFANKNGCCTTFAVAMFAKLAPTSATRGARVEIVSVGSGSSGTHVFLVVGRNAGVAGTVPNAFNKGGSFPACATWGADTVVIDPWLMSLGHDGINLDPLTGPRTAKCNSGQCTGMCENAHGGGVGGVSKWHAGTPTDWCFTHGESLGFDPSILLFEKAKVV